MRNEKLIFLAGSWELVEARFVAPDASTHMPWGPSPIGMAVFAKSGDFAAYVMRARRHRFASDRPTPDEKQQTYDDYFSYFGRIVRFDDAESRMTSQVLGASNANWIGGEQVRYLEIEDENHIVFRTPPLSMGGTTVVGRLRWQRRHGDGA